jgi:hypothetical protein
MVEDYPSDFILMLRGTHSPLTDSNILAMTSSDSQAGLPSRIHLAGQYGAAWLMVETLTPLVVAQTACPKTDWRP